MKTRMKPVLYATSQRLRPRMHTCQLKYNRKQLIFSRKQLNHNPAHCIMLIGNIKTKRKNKLTLAAVNQPSTVAGHRNIF